MRDRPGLSITIEPSPRGALISLAAFALALFLIGFALGVLMVPLL